MDEPTTLTDDEIRTERRERERWAEVPSDTDADDADVDADDADQDADADDAS